MIIVDKTWPTSKPIPSITKSIFLAGPSPRDGSTDWQGTWREEAVKLLEKLGFDGHVFIPLPFNGMSYAEGVQWEEHLLEIADQILFWVPRSKDLPAFTTNIEFGEWMKSGKVVLGYPEDAERMRYLEAKVNKYGSESYDNLEDTVKACVANLGEGAKRVDGEIHVPLHVWRSEYFKHWYQNHKKVGNKLVDGKLLWDFRVGPKQFLFSWVYKASIYVKAEDRIKDNEYVFTRSDIAVIVAYVKGESLLQTKILTIKEFRTPARTNDGFVHELPGGSSFKANEDPLVLASHELEEETGLKIDPTRFMFRCKNQLVSTLSSHVAHIFSVEITEDELKTVIGTESGVAEDTEHTYVGVATYQEILHGIEQFDLSMIGIVSTVLNYAM
jgi:ADP-ribose pyrophosphatase YjhB (NUDIX family)